MSIYSAIVTITRLVKTKRGDQKRETIVSSIIYKEGLTKEEIIKRCLAKGSEITGWEVTKVTPTSKLGLETGELIFKNKF